ncbi:DUF3021 family protein [Anaerotaenia torta]|uniref:DUF3021 family protein n=1 Tax=Anaerotaenia torta TaxID=433293 RepID=UPI003D1DE568
MSFKVFLKRCLMEYFIVTTCVTAAIAVLGLSLDPTARFGYEGFFSPLIFGLISLVPSFVTYSRRELSLRQALVRKVFHVIVLEAMLIAFGFWTGLLHSPAESSFFGLAVFAVYIAVNLISWLLDKKEADEINKTLKSLQDTDIRNDV